MSPQQVAWIIGAIGLAVTLALIMGRKRIGELNAASWLVVWGAVVMIAEHPQFAIAYTVPFEAIADELRANPLTLSPHARLHFFMAGIYAAIGAALLCVIARTLLRAGQRAGWYAVLFALIVGGVFDVVIGIAWYQHGAPLVRFLGQQPLGFGWEFLYGYFIAWSTALAISYNSIFAKGAG